MIIETFPSGPFETNVIILGCQETKAAAIIDPAPNSTQKIQDYVRHNQLKVEKILLTHTHWDHFGDAAKLKKQYQAPLYAHADDAENLRNPGHDGIPLMMPIDPVEPDHLIKDGDEIEVGTLKLTVLHTPGHSPGCVCFYIPKHHVLITGDTLFKGSIGNLAFPTSNSDQMWKSLERLTTLPPETKIYPGHGEPSTLAAENWLPKAKEIFGI